MDSRTKRLAVAALAALLATAAAACGGTRAEAGAEPEARPSVRPTVALALPSLDTAFFDRLRWGAEAEAETQGATLVVNDAEGSADTQNRQLRRIDARETTAVVLAPVDSAGAARAVRDLRNRDVPVVTADRAVEGVRADAAVASDNNQGGWKAATTLGELLGGKGQVVHIQGPRDTSVSRERGDGFTEGLKEYPGVEVVAGMRAGFDRYAGQKAMAALLAQHPDLSGVFAENDEMALGALEALGDRAGRSVDVVGFDGTAEARTAVERGKLSATIAQDPAELGRLAVRNALRVASGEQVEEDILVPVSVVAARD